MRTGIARVVMEDRIPSRGPGRISSQSNGWKERKAAYHGGKQQGKRDAEATGNNDPEHEKDEGSTDACRPETRPLVRLHR
jgi:hypothetical protein